MTTVAVIIVSYNTRELLRRCLGALDQSHGVELRVIVVDNGSSDGSAAMVTATFPRAELIDNQQNMGFAAANNQGLRRALADQPPDYLMLLNSDAFVAPETLCTLASYLDAHPAVGAAGPQLRNGDGSLQPSGRDFPTLRSTLADLTGWSRRGGRDPFRQAGRDYGAVADVDEVSGACIIARGELVCQVGGLDEGFFFNYEDVDWCRRIKLAGWRIVYLPQAQVTHLWGSSQNKVVPRVYLESRRGLLRYFRKYGRRGELAALRLALVLLEGLTFLRWCVLWALWPPRRAHARQVLPLKARVCWLALQAKGW